MSLGFGSYARMERMLLRTRNILGENDPAFKEDNKTQALQYAADHYGLFSGNASDTTYTDSASLTISQSEMIATFAAIELIRSAISFYKDDVVTANGGPASVNFRSDKLAWLKSLLDELKEKLDELEDKNDVGDLAAGKLPGLFVEKARACADPVDDVCPCEEPKSVDFTGVL